MPCSCMNCGLFLGDKNNMQKKSTYKTIHVKVSFSEAKSWRNSEGKASHSSPVREVIPLSPSHPLLLFLPYAAANYFTVPQREVAFPGA